QLIGTLSKGYRQRVGLADVLLAEPPVLILDEPTAGLDPTQIRSTRTLIRELGQQHTLLLSTHILTEVELVCDHAIIIHKGVVAAAGPLKDLAQQAGEQGVLAVTFLGAVEPVPLRQLPGVHDVGVKIHDGETALRIAAHRPDNLAPKVYEVAAQHG